MVMTTTQETQMAYVESVYHVTRPQSSCLRWAAVNNFMVSIPFTTNEYTCRHLSPVDEVAHVVPHGVLATTSAVSMFSCHHLTPGLAFPEILS